MNFKSGDWLFHEKSNLLLELICNCEDRWRIDQYSKYKNIYTNIMAKNDFLKECKKVEKQEADKFIKSVINRILCDKFGHKITKEQYEERRNFLKENNNEMGK